MLSIGSNAFHAFSFYFHSLLLLKYLLHKTIQIKGGGDMIEVMLSFFITVAYGVLVMVLLMS